jgi:uncharacterized protein
MKSVINKHMDSYSLAEVYLFEHKGVNILLDVKKSNFYSIEKGYVEVIEYLLDKKDNNKAVLSVSDEELEEIMKNLIDAEILIDSDVEEEKTQLDFSKEVVNMVLNISQDCNLRCKYCFASTGHYKGKRELMSVETAHKALDWFYAQAVTSEYLNLHLFGGEPLMNIPLVEEIVKYTKELSAKYDKKIFINICTNGTIMNDELLQLIKENEIGLQISIDGPKEIHDMFRPTAENGSSYDLIKNNLPKLFDELDKNSIIPRSTVSRGVTDINGVVNHLLDDLGFTSVFFIPAMGCDNLSYAEEDLNMLFSEYDKLVDTFLNKLRNGEEYNIFPLISEIDAVGKGIRRIYGCGAGIGFASIDVKGDIYPCMRFTNNADYAIGNIYTGFNEKRQKLLERTIYNRPKCATCWARHLCGGACIAIPVENGGDLKNNNEITCQVAQHIAKLAMYANVVIRTENLKFDKNQLKVTDFMRRRFQ